MKRESILQAEVLLEYGGKPDIRLFRNNVGVAKYPDGSTVVYGLCRGSSDLIGWKSVTITPDMVGQRLAVFAAAEIKTPGRRPTVEQGYFIEAVQRAGGIAGVIYTRDDAERLFFSPEGKEPIKSGDGNAA